MEFSKLSTLKGRCRRHKEMENRRFQEKLNDVTVGDSFPIPLISGILYALGISKYFTIDCANGFLQVPVKPEDQPKTAFSTREGIFNIKGCRLV
jgi:hypothetical protein